jgi:hypothetical protein
MIQCVDRKFLLAREHLIRHSLLYEKGKSEAATATGKDLYLAVPAALDAVKNFADELRDILTIDTGVVMSDDVDDAEMKVDTE